MDLTEPVREVSTTPIGRSHHHWMRYYRLRTYSTESLRNSLTKSREYAAKGGATSPGYLRELEIILMRRLLTGDKPVMRVFTIPSDKMKRNFTG